MHDVFDDHGFNMITPVRGGTIYIATSEDSIEVRISGIAGESYQATLFEFTVGVGIGAELGIDPTPLPAVGGNPTTFSAMLDPFGDDLGTGAGNNRAVKVDDLRSGDSESFAFRVEVGTGPSSGSGRSSGSGEHRKKFKPKFSLPGQLVPVTVALKLDSKVTKGTCAKCAELNRPTMLLHTRDPKYANAWLSRPIAFCGKGTPAGYWILQKSGPTDWTMVLKQADKVIVTYTAKTKPKDCSLPIKLKRKGVGAAVCKAWPKTVTISPAV